MNSIPANKSKRYSLLVASLLMLAFLLSQSDRALAQSVTGSGTIGRIPRWVPGSSVLGDSVITQADTTNFIGIGTTDPLAVLHVVSSTSSIFTRTATTIQSQPQSALQLGISGTVATAGVGPSMLFFSDNSAATKQFLGRVSAAWENPTAGSEAAGLIFSVRATSAYTTASTEVMRINSSGRVGIGTTSPTRSLDILDSAANGIEQGVKITGSAGVRLDLWSNNPNTSARNWTIRPDTLVFGDFSIMQSNARLGDPFGAGTSRLYINSNGNVGIGTTNPTLKLTVVGGRGYVASQDAYAIGVSNNSGAFWLGATNVATPDLLLSNNVGTERVRVTDAGRVGVGTSAPSTALHVVGDLTLTGSGNIIASGNIAAKYQDVAEWVPTRHILPVGTVVVLDTELSNHVMSSSKAYDTKVAGVISEKPGVILGEAGEGKVMVATTGRVRVKVDATKGPIQVGDLLVTSTEEGIAMRSEPLDLAGTKIHRPGTIIGKALEPLAKGKGEILVLLSMQ